MKGLKMKGLKMKDKIILSVSVLVLFGIIWLNNVNQKNNSKLTVKEETLPPVIENFSENQIDGPESMTTKNEKSNASDSPSCSFEPGETDVLTFGNAFKYYRQCLGSKSDFKWRGNVYTTILSNEQIIEMADSIHIKETEATEDVFNTHIE